MMLPESTAGWPPPQDDSAYGQRLGIRDLNHYQTEENSYTVSPTRIDSNLSSSTGRPRESQFAPTKSTDSDWTSTPFSFIDTQDTPSKPEIGSDNALSHTRSIPPSPTLTEILCGALPSQAQKPLPRKDGWCMCKYASCFQFFDTKARMEQHYRCHIPEQDRKIKCPACGKGFNTMTAIIQHTVRTGCQAPHNALVSQLQDLPGIPRQSNTTTYIPRQTDPEPDQLESQATGQSLSYAKQTLLHDNAMRSNEHPPMDTEPSLKDLSGLQVEPQGRKLNCSYCNKYRRQCDKMNPCSLCKKLGLECVPLSSQQVARSCNRCQRNGMICSQSQPCSHCIRLSQKCYFGPLRHACERRSHKKRKPEEHGQSREPLESTHESGKVVDGVDINMFGVKNSFNGGGGGYVGSERLVPHDTTGLSLAQATQQLGQITRPQLNDIQLNSPATGKTTQMLGAAPFRNEQVQMDLTSAFSTPSPSFEHSLSQMLADARQRMPSTASDGHRDSSSLLSTTETADQGLTLETESME